MAMTKEAAVVVATKETAAMTMAKEATTVAATKEAATVAMAKESRQQLLGGGYVVPWV